jgi:hypothetical protein
MPKKIFVNLLTALIISAILTTIFLARKEVPLIKSLMGIDSKTKVFQERLDKHLFTDPNLKGFTIDNALAVKRIVYLFQWNEIITENGVTYEKIWSQELIKSDNFSDRTKRNPVSKGKYKDLEVIFRTKVFKDFTINNSHMAGKIRYEKLNLEKTHINRSFDGVEEIVDGWVSTDFGGDLDTYVFNAQKVKKDNFRLFEKNALVNSINPKEPQIGDIKIEYRVFSPDFVIIFARITGEKPQAKNIIFTKNMYDFIHSRFIKFTVVVSFIVYTNVIFGAWLVSINNIRKYAKRFILKSVLFVNEYLIFGQSCWVSFFLTILSISFIVSQYAFLLVVGMLACAVNRDLNSV